MIANGVSVSFDIGLIVALFGLVLAGYAFLWGFPRLLALFRN